MASKIEDYGLIGNTLTSALVSVTVEVMSPTLGDVRRRGPLPPQQGIPTSAGTTAASRRGQSLRH